MIDNTEDKDWLNDYPALKEQKKDNPFLVPANYFEEQQDQIRTAVFAQQLKENTDLPGFTVPQNYFENLQNEILSRVNIGGIDASENSFTVPDQFFEEQQSNIASRIIIDEFAGKEHGFIIPDQFFESQISQISSRIIIDEFAGEQNGFTVPANYFDQLQEKITSKTGVKEVQQPAKIRTLFTKAAWKYATAACIAVAVITGVAIKQYNQPVNIQTQLSHLPDADIENYLKINSDTYDNHVILENSTSDTEAELGIINDQANTDSNATNKN